MILIILMVLMILIISDHPTASYSYSYYDQLHGGKKTHKNTTRRAEVRGGQAPDPQCEPICFGSLASPGHPGYSSGAYVHLFVDERLLLNDEIQLISIPMTNISDTLWRFVKVGTICCCCLFGNGRQLLQRLMFSHVFTCFCVRCSCVEIC